MSTSKEAGEAVTLPPAIGYVGFNTEQMQRLTLLQTRKRRRHGSH